MMAQLREQQDLGCEKIFHVLGSIAQFERQIMLERQREGIAKAKTGGLYKGRQKTAEQHKGTILERHSVAAILKQIRASQDKKGMLNKIGRSSGYQIIADYKKEAEAEVFEAAQHV
jgi:DNA invertase Pin-like site-specific DNA recombinase